MPNEQDVKIGIVAAARTTGMPQAINDIENLAKATGKAAAGVKEVEVGLQGLGTKGGSGVGGIVEYLAAMSTRTDQAQRSLSKMNSTLDQLTRSAPKVSGRFALTGDYYDYLQSSLAGRIAGLWAVLRGVTNAYKTAAELDTAFRQLAFLFSPSSMEASVGGIDKASEAMSLATGIAMKYGLVLKDVVNVMLEMGRQGKSANQIGVMAEGLAEIKTLLISSGASAVTYAEMMKYSTMIQQQYNLTTNETLDMLRKMAALDVQTPASFERIAQAMQRSAATAKAAGVSYDALVRSATALSAAGFTGEQAGTALNTLIARVTRSAQAVSFLQDKLGISITTSDKGFVHMKDSLTLMMEAYEKLLEPSKQGMLNEFAELVAGTRQRSKLLALLDVLHRNDAAYKEITASAGMAGRTASQVADELIKLGYKEGSKELNDRVSQIMQAEEIRLKNIKYLTDGVEAQYERINTAFSSFYGSKQVVDFVSAAADGFLFFTQSVTSTLGIITSFINTLGLAKVGVLSLVTVFSLLVGRTVVGAFTRGLLLLDSLVSKIRVVNSLGAKVGFAGQETVDTILPKISTSIEAAKESIARFEAAQSRIQASIDKANLQKATVVGTLPSSSVSALQTESVKAVSKLKEVLLTQQKVAQYAVDSPEKISSALNSALSKLLLQQARKLSTSVANSSVFKSDQVLSVEAIDKMVGSVKSAVSSSMVSVAEAYRKALVKNTKASTIDQKLLGSAMESTTSEMLSSITSSVKTSYTKILKRMSADISATPTDTGSAAKSITALYTKLNAVLGTAVDSIGSAMQSGPKSSAAQGAAAIATKISLAILQYTERVANTIIASLEKSATGGVSKQTASTAAALRQGVQAVQKTSGNISSEQSMAAVAESTILALTNAEALNAQFQSMATKIAAVATEAVNLTKSLQTAAASAKSLSTSMTSKPMMFASMVGEVATFTEALDASISKVTTLSNVVASALAKSTTAIAAVRQATVESTAAASVAANVVATAGSRTKPLVSVTDADVARIKAATSATETNLAAQNALLTAAEAKAKATRLAQESEIANSAAVQAGLADEAAAVKLKALAEQKAAEASAARMNAAETARIAEAAVRAAEQEADAINKARIATELQVKATNAASAALRKEVVASNEVAKVQGRIVGILEGKRQLNAEHIRLVEEEQSAARAAAANQSDAAALQAAVAAKKVELQERSNQLEAASVGLANQNAVAQRMVAEAVEAKAAAEALALESLTAAQVAQAAKSATVASPVSPGYITSFETARNATVAFTEEMRANFLASATSIGASIDSISTKAEGMRLSGPVRAQVDQVLESAVHMKNGLVQQVQSIPIGKLVPVRDLEAMQQAIQETEAGLGKFNTRAGLYFQEVSNGFGRMVNTIIAHAAMLGNVLGLIFLASFMWDMAKQITGWGRTVTEQLDALKKKYVETDASVEAAMSGMRKSLTDYSQALGGMSDIGDLILSKLTSDLATANKIPGSVFIKFVDEYNDGLTKALREGKRIDVKTYIQDTFTKALEGATPETKAAVDTFIATAFSDADTQQIFADVQNGINVATKSLTTSMEDTTRVATAQEEKIAELKATYEGYQKQIAEGEKQLVTLKAALPFAGGEAYSYRLAAQVANLQKELDKLREMASRVNGVITESTATLNSLKTATNEAAASMQGLLDSMAGVDKTLASNTLNLKREYLAALKKLNAESVTGGTSAKARELKETLDAKARAAEINVNLVKQLDLQERLKSSSVINSDERKKLLEQLNTLRKEGIDLETAEQEAILGARTAGYTAAKRDTGAHQDLLAILKKVKDAKLDDLETKYLQEGRYEAMESKKFLLEKQKIMQEYLAILQETNVGEKKSADKMKEIADVKRQILTITKSIVEQERELQQTMLRDRTSDLIDQYNRLKDVLSDQQKETFFQKWAADIQVLTDELERLKAAGASDSAIYAKQREIAEQKKSYQVTLTESAMGKWDYEQTVRSQDELTRALLQLKDAFLTSPYGESKFQYDTKGLFQTFQDFFTRGLQKTLEEYRTLQSNENMSPEKYADASSRIQQNAEQFFSDLQNYFQQALQSMSDSIPDPKAQLDMVAGMESAIDSFESSMQGFEMNDTLRKSLSAIREFLQNFKKGIEESTDEFFSQTKDYIMSSMQSGFEIGMSKGFTAEGLTDFKKYIGTMVAKKIGDVLMKTLSEELAKMLNESLFKDLTASLQNVLGPTIGGMVGNLMGSILVGAMSSILGFIIGGTLGEIFGTIEQQQQEQAKDRLSASGQQWEYKEGERTTPYYEFAPPVTNESVKIVKFVTTFNITTDAAMAMASQRRELERVVEEILTKWNRNVAKTVGARV